MSVLPVETVSVRRTKESVLTAVIFCVMPTPPSVGRAGTASVTHTQPVAFRMATPTVISISLRVLSVTLRAMQVSHGVKIT